MIDDEQLDRLLDAAVSVSPSPGFRARVVARIAAEPPPCDDRRWLLWSGLAAATVVLALAVTRPLTETADGVHRPTLDSVGAWTLSAVVLPAARVPPSLSVSGTSRRRDALAARFDRREREAFAWFRGMASAATLVSTGVPIDEAEPSVPPLEIAALDVSPIALTEGSEGEPHR